MPDLLKTTLNTRSLVLCLIILVAGLSAGIFFAGIVPDQEKVYLVTLLQNSSARILPVLLTNTAALLLIGLAGFTVYGFPVALIFLWFRGFSVGFCDCLLLYNISSGSIAGFIFSFLLPQILLCSVYLLAVTVSTGYALQQLRPAS